MSDAYSATEHRVKCSDCGWDGGEFSCNMTEKDESYTSEGGISMPHPILVRICPKCSSEVNYGKVRH